MQGMKLINLIRAKEIRKPLAISWSIAALAALSVPTITGQIYGPEEAKDLLASVQKSSLYYGAAVATASSTILALTLTILSLTKGYKDDPAEETFTRLHAIAAFSVYGFFGAIILLLFISFPVNNFEKIPGRWYSYVYYIVCAWNGMLAGIMMSTILILKDTSSNIIGSLSPDFDKEGHKEDN